MSRRTSLTPETQEKVVEHIRAGNYRETAARAAGITRQTLWNWEQRALTGEEPFASFAEALDQAEAEAETTMLARVNAAGPAVTGVSGPDPWQATAWVMERRWPKRWASRVRTVVAEEVEGLEKKLRAKPALAAEVADVLAREGDGAPSREPH